MNKEYGKPDAKSGASVVNLHGRKREHDANMVSRFLSDFSFQSAVKRVARLIVHVFFVAVGCGAAYVSFLVEKDAFLQISGNAGFAFWIVLIFEAAKVGTIIVYDKGYFRTGAFATKDGITWIVKSLQCLLILLSFTCSLSVISKCLDRPDLEKARTADIERIELRFATDMETLRQNRETETAGFRERFERQFEGDYEKIRSFYESKIAGLEKDLLNEMKNVDRNGNFIGKRYREFKRRLEETKAEYHAKIEDVNHRRETSWSALEQALSEKEAVFKQKAEDLAAAKNRDIEQAAKSAYANDERAANKLVTATLRTLNDGIFNPLFGFVMKPVVFSALFSLLIAVLLEMVIFICFSSIDLSSPEADMMEALRKQMYSVDG